MAEIDLLVEALASHREAEEWEEYLGGDRHSGIGQVLEWVASTDLQTAAEAVGNCPREDWKLIMMIYSNPPEADLERLGWLLVGQTFRFASACLPGLGSFADNVSMNSCREAQEAARTEGRQAAAGAPYQERYVCARVATAIAGSTVGRFETLYPANYTMAGRAASAAASAAAAMRTFVSRETFLSRTYSAGADLVASAADAAADAAAYATGSKAAFAGARAEQVAWARRILLLGEG